MFWKKLAINMHLVSQFLFVLSTIWDFFLTVIIHSVRSGIFDMVPSWAIFIIGPWIIMIFILSFLLIVSIVTEDRPVVKHDTYGYVVMIIIYAILFLLSLFNPLISWPLLLNYLVSILWATSLAYFKLAIIKGK